MNTTTAFIAPTAGRPRRLHSAEFKAKVVDACGQPGVSIAGIALANGINANLARRWMKASSTPRATGQTGAVTSFVPVRFEPEPVSPSASDIRIEVRRENLMRPWALGRNNAKCSFMRSQRRGATCRPCGRWCGHFT